jgi:hypothetical protein
MLGDTSFIRRALIAFSELLLALVLPGLSGAQALASVEAIHHAVMTSPDRKAGSVTFRPEYCTDNPDACV